MTENSEQLILSKIADLHTDVREIRTTQKEHGAEINGLKVAMAQREGRDRTLKYVFNVVLPFLVAIVGTVTALAFGL